MIELILALGQAFVLIPTVGGFLLLCMWLVARR